MNFNPSYVGIRNDLLKHIAGTNLDILDVGCATGENGRFLLDHHIAKSVIGVELDVEMANQAKNKIQKVFNDSIEKEEILTEIKNSNFDIIILGDVLEHLIDPWKILRELATTLKPKGKIIISIPNVQHIDIFINVFVKGTWPLNSRGLFDKTHLRWFTKKDLESLITQAGLKVIRLERKFRFRDTLQSIRFPIWAYPLRILMPNLFTHQYIAVVQRRI